LFQNFQKIVFLLFKKQKKNQFKYFAEIKNPHGGEEIRHSRNDDVNRFPTEYFSKYETGSSDIKNKTFAYLVLGSSSALYASALKNGVYDLLNVMSPSADVLAMANIEVDLTKIAEGSTLTVKWRGKPLFIRHRNAKEIDMAKNTPLSELKDPETDEKRAINPNYLICLGVCTHLGCVPMPNQGDYNGWFCPCHGSHYDTSGRIRKGPAPLNLEVPDYFFINPETVMVGTKG